MTRKISFSLFLALALAAPACRPAHRAGENEAKPASETRGTAGAAHDPSSPGELPEGQFMGINAEEFARLSVEVKTVTAGYMPLSYVHSALGKVAAPQSKMALVSYAFPARISEIHARVGDWVKKGQLLLTLQSEEVGKAKTDYYKAVTDTELAKRTYEREQKLFERGVGAQKNTFASETEYKLAQANLDAAEKRLHVLGFTEDDVAAMAKTHQINPTIQLFAPIHGRIIEHKALLGAMIDQTTELLTILDPTVLWIDAEIFERDISKIRIGQEVQVTVPAYPEAVFTGKLSYISDFLKEETRTIAVRTEVENRQFKLKPGMFAEMRIRLGQQAKALVLPEEAVLDDRGASIVFVKLNGVYLPRQVALGVKEKGFYEIRSGIAEGEQVVTRGSFQMKSKMYEEIFKSAGAHSH